MRSLQVRLYGFAPLALLPLMDFSISEIPDWFKSDEFKNLAGELVIQFLSGIVSAIIQTAFGLV